MTLRPQPLPPIPEATAAAVQAAFPKGNLYVALRTEFGTLFTLLHDFRHRLLAHAAGQRFLESPPGHLQRAGVDQSPGHATHRFHACPGGDPHAAPFGVCSGSDA